VYALTDPSSLAQGAASATALLANQVTLKVKRPGTALIRVRFSPYWALSGVPGCVAPAGDFTRATFHRAGTARLVIRFAFRRAGARSPRCNSATR
jgi:hypothetical protein